MAVGLRLSSRPAIRSAERRGLPQSPEPL